MIEEKQNHNNNLEKGASSKGSTKRTFNFNISGLSYKLRTSQEEKTVIELVQFVERKIQQAQSATKNGSFQNAAVLAALNIAEELILLKKRVHSELELLENKTLKIAREIKASHSTTTTTSQGEHLRSLVKKKKS